MTDKMVTDIHAMHAKFGVHDAVANFTPSMAKAFLKFRLACIDEELNETRDAVADGDPEEVVDGLIDILVFTIGTLDLLSINTEKAWDEVVASVRTKEVGVKPGRPNPHGLPDLLKPEGWKPPSHKGNHGKLKEIFNA